MVSYMATAVLSVGLLAGAPQSPQWEPSYGKALKATRAGDDPLLIVLDKPNSKEARLEPELLGQDVVDREEMELLRPYQLCHIDVTTNYGRKVARAFRVREFPHVAIIDKTGSTVIFRKTGKIRPAEWERILSRHKSGERSLARAVSRTTYRPSGAISSDMILGPSCPNCQRGSF